LKKFLVTLLTVSILFNLCSFEVSAKEKSVIRVYNWGEYISNGDDDSLDVIAEFEKRYPEYTVEYTTYANNEEMYAKIMSGSAKYDVIIPSDYMISKMIQEDMLAKLDYSNIPNYKYIDDEFKNLEFDPNNEYSVPYTWGIVGIIYNTKKVTEPVDSWDILWDEKYANQILMFDNPRDSYGIAMKRLGFSQNSTNKEEYDLATISLQEQKTVLQAYVNDQIFAKMTNGEAALAPYYAGDALTMMDDNPDLAFAVPKEGTNKFVDAMVVLKDAPNKTGAEKFINFMLEPEIALANIEYIGYSTPMSIVKDMLDEEVINNGVSYPSEEILSKCETFLNLPDNINSYMQEKWIEVKATGENNIGAIIQLIVTMFVMVVLVVLLLIRKRRNRG
jgi:spermidine/putrescine transport system substrate-binding protein